MADHIKRAFADLKGFKNRDIFLSLFECVSDENGKNQNLKYLCHWDPKKDSIFSPTISLNSPKYKKYECVKAVLESRQVIAKWDCSDYFKGNQRGKIHHYVGLRIEFHTETLGFLNVEFHNRSFFKDQQALMDFVENELVAFKYLIEYQFLKRRFFTVVKKHLTEDKI